MQRLIDMPEANAKSILLALCADNSQLEQRALKLLDQIGALDLRSTAGEQQRGTKRKAGPPIKICVQCQEAFYEEENNDGACRYHDGKLEVDDERGFWDDHDELCHGPIDTEGNRIEYPKGFVWSCCGKLGHRGGCKRGRHNAHNVQRGKYGDKPRPWERQAGESVSSSEDSSNGLESESDDDKPQDN